MFRPQIDSEKIKMKINNSLLKKLDQEVGNFYKLSERYSSSLNNLYGKQIYKERLTELLKKSDKIKPEGQFDNLILRNIQSNLKLNDLTMDYFTDSNFPLSVKDFFNKLAGEKTFEYLEQKVKDAPWEKRWEYSEKTQERNHSTVNPFIENAQKSAREWLPKIKKDILEYGKSKGYLPKDFKMGLLLLPPRDGFEMSSWNSKTNIFSLGSYGFKFFSKNGKIIANPTTAYNVAFHEVLGHGAHQIHSEQMPHSLRFTEEIGRITPTKSISEGVAINTEKKSYGFLKKRLKKLGVSKEDISLLKEESDLEQQGRTEQMYYSLIKDRELREKDFDGYEHVLQLTQNPMVARMFKDDFKSGFIDAWRIIGHTLGPLHYKKMLDKVEQKLGKNYLDKKDANKVTFQGAWSHEVYPDAVLYMLENKE